jgi:hypothetical protein
MLKSGHFTFSDEEKSYNEACVNDDVFGHIE